jgi:hypothetical protein
MPRRKKAKALYRSHRHGPLRLPRSDGKLKKEPQAAAGRSMAKSRNGKNQGQTQQGGNQRPIIPFSRKDRILLIGEGKLDNDEFDSLLNE